VNITANIRLNGMMGRIGENMFKVVWKRKQRLEKYVEGLNYGTSCFSRRRAVGSMEYFI
jgi:hypothetical protein